MKIIAMLSVLLLATLVIGGEVASKHSVQRAEGFVPDEATAVRIAEAVLIPIYGEKSITGERPFTATLTNGVWTVKGTLAKGYTKGGVALVELSKKDACVLRITHGK